MSFPFYRQLDATDCGPTCLRMISKHYGKSYTIQYLRDQSYITRNGVSMLGISEAAEQIGLRALGVRIGFDKLAKNAILPCIVHWRQNHFVVVYKISIKKSKKNNSFTGTVYVSDPAFGLIEYTIEDFLNGWISTKISGEDRGMVLMLSPTIDFYKKEMDLKDKKASIRYFYRYLLPYRKLFLQVMLGILVGMFFQLIFPFLAQSMVDVGIGTSNLSFVVMLLIAQLIISFSQMIISFVQSWIFLHTGTRIGVTLVSDFIYKLLKMPMRFFDSKMLGDIMQRIGDNSRIQNFITSAALNTPFMILNFFIYAGILAYYNYKILLIFIFGYVIYLLWIVIFLKYRRELDYKRFEKSAQNQSSLIQLVNGVHEIKTNNCEKKLRWQWENIQANLFAVSIKGTAIGQYQGAGLFFISHAINITISVIAASEVINGRMTFGMMMALSYIIGQLKGPMDGFLGFVYSFQDAKISLERLSEIHFKEDEDQENAIKINELPDRKDITVSNLCFGYQGPQGEMVLKDISFTIPEKKITAIVGTSGSGKTTLLKLLMGHYLPISGEIKINNVNLRNINSRVWRDRCGVVLQEGFLFSDTIAENIALSDEEINKKKMYNAAEIACIKEFIESLPAGYNNRVGMEGSGVSKGQAQRLLIARAVYKDPDVLFFDEATNSLDANTESQIMKNLSEFFRGRTVIIVAHRLSTVKNADQILVIEKGKIIELGTHKELVEKKGNYYELVKNQLELGNE